MGAKTAIVAFVDGDASERLRKADRLTVEAAQQLVGRVHPDRPADRVPDARLGDEI